MRYPVVKAIPVQSGDNRETPTLQMLDFDQFLSEVRYCHQLQKDSCRAGL